MQLVQAIWKIPFLAIALLPTILAILFVIALQAGCSGVASTYDDSCAFGGEGLHVMGIFGSFFFLMFFIVSVPWLIGGLFVATRILKTVDFLEYIIYGPAITLLLAMISHETWISWPVAATVFLVLALVTGLLHQRDQRRNNQ